MDLMAIRLVWSQLIFRMLCCTDYAKGIFMSIEWLFPIGLLILAMLTPDKTLTWVFGVLGLLMLGYFMGHSGKDK
jgi:hypothetical protein